MDIQAMIMKPNVKLKAKQPELAIAGHILSLLAVLLLFIYAIVTLIQVRILTFLLLLIFAAFICIIESDVTNIPVAQEQLVDPLIRGIVWVVLGIIAWILPFSWISPLVLVIAGACYIIYNFM